MDANEQPQQIVIPADDAVVVFRTVKSGARGRLVRLGAAADSVLAAHALPAAAADVLGQALALAALIGSALPAEGKLILQTKTNGPVSFLVADYEAPGRIRGYARFDAAGLASTGEARRSSADVIGDGHLAITIDPGAGTDRYQAVTALDRVTLSAAAEQYFENREALPTLVRLAVARHYANGAWSWRAGGLMVQSLGETERGEEDSSEDWNRVRTLAATVEDQELLDPMLSAERLLLRLFHEEGVRVERADPIQRYCRCSRERVAGVITSFGPKEIADMRNDDGRIVVTCEFCAAAYDFDPADFEPK